MKSNIEEEVHVQVSLSRSSIERKRWREKFMHHISSDLKRFA